ncbi:hypothetical protein BHM03_00051578 [Ensete ventricosum]|nr:hypothetical protein BHM03_00051578 [Ensete ventricosum]
MFVFLIVECDYVELSDFENCSNSWCNSGQAPFEASGIHWMYEIWSSPCSKVSMFFHMTVFCDRQYANEDVSLGSWFIGLDVEHIDDRRLCCGTPPAIIYDRLMHRCYLYADCEWKAQAGNICVASFDWSCSGICNSAERIKEVHRRCGEGKNALLNAVF